MPRAIVYGLIIVFVLGLIPLALIARERTTTSPRPRLQLIPDMDQQAKYKAQSANPLFADGRAMRAPPAGTVARDEPRADAHLREGRRDGDWAAGFPLPVTESLLSRGRERYRIFCAPCHGLDGGGDGPVARRADRLQEGTWTPPTSLHTDVVRERPAGHLYNTIANGIRNMPAYGPQLAPQDRWAVVAYVRALQRSQNATLADVPAQERPALR